MASTLMKDLINLGESQPLSLISYLENNCRQLDCTVTLIFAPLLIRHQSFGVLKRILHPKALEELIYSNRWKYLAKKICHMYIFPDSVRLLKTLDLVQQGQISQNGFRDLLLISSVCVDQDVQQIGDLAYLGTDMILQIGQVLCPLCLHNFGVTCKFLLRAFRENVILLTREYDDGLYCLSVKKVFNIYLISNDSHVREHAKELLVRNAEFKIFDQLLLIHEGSYSSRPEFPWFQLIESCIPPFEEDILTILGTPTPLLITIFCAFSESFLDTLLAFDGLVSTFSHNDLSDPINTVLYAANRLYYSKHILRLILNMLGPSDITSKTIFNGINSEIPCEIMEQLLMMYNGQITDRHGYEILSYMKDYPSGLQELIKKLDPTRFTFQVDHVRIILESRLSSIMIDSIFKDFKIGSIGGTEFQLMISRGIEENILVSAIDKLDLNDINFSKDTLSAALEKGYSELVLSKIIAGIMRSN